MDISSMKWINRPKEAAVSSDRIEIVTEPRTDLWQRTYYHFRNDNAPMLQLETHRQFFTFSVHADFTGSAHRFDQCGIIRYLDAENWIKASVEYENDQYQNLGSVVTNLGYSDWAATPISPDIRQMWYRLSRREDDYCIENSEDGITYHAMRICHLARGTHAVRFGVYACSPEDSSFQAVFTDLELTDCLWKAHDGQQPD